MKTTNAVVAMAAAAAAGVVIGMLIAPEKGSDLQKRLKMGAQGWLDEIAKLMNMRKELAANESEEQTQDARNN